MKIFTILLAILIFSGCSLLKSEKIEFAPTYAEEKAGYSYIPVEPSSVSIQCETDDGDQCATIRKRSLLNALPDNSVRIATRLVSGKAKVGAPVFGADIGVAGNSYEIIIDFVNTQTINKPFLGKWFVSVSDQLTVLPNRCYPVERSVLSVYPFDKHETMSLKATLLQATNQPDNLESLKEQIAAFEALSAARSENKAVTLNCGADLQARNGQTIPYQEIKIPPEVFNIPVYVGIGLRLKANVTVIKGTLNLTSLPAITAAVKNETATGSLSVQTIGISGKTARSGLLLLDKIDTTTIQNAIQVLSSIKASIESEDTTISPRIVGFHNTIGAGAQGINLIHSLLVGNSTLAVEINESAYASGSSSK